MTLSRWKMMAVGLGVSLGGLAAMAGQCPKIDSNKGRTAEVPPALDVPALPPPPIIPASKEMPPSAPALPGVPSPPLPTPATGVPVIPPAPSSAPASVPPLPTPISKVEKKPEPVPDTPAILPVVPASASESPKLPPAMDVIPVDKIPSPTLATTPQAPAATGSAALPATETGLPAPGALPPPVPDAGAAAIESKPAKPTATKFRILLRVGEGDPSFEVKCGDELVLKVVCEKVDIKSPEKGSGPSTVKASGKVRFAGFGAEGVCGELSFLAGTGEVMMAKDVNIKVKDKLGRVESEFTTQSVTYKLDPTPFFPSTH